MELKEYLQIIKRYKKTFLIIWGMILFFSLFTIFVQPIIYEGETTVLVTRNNKNGEINISEKYDYYYQLESDRRIAGMLVQFLADKALLNKIFDGNDLNGKNAIQKIVIPKAEKKWMINELKGAVLDGGYIKIIIYGHNKDLIRKVNDRLVGQLENKILKVVTNKNNSVKLEAESVVITEKRKLYLPVALGAFFGGLLVAIFVVLGMHYWKEEE